MKKLSLMMMIALSAFMFQACSGPKAGDAGADSAAVTDTTAKTDSATMAPDSAAAGGAQASNADPMDIKFATTAAAGGLAEVATGKIASEKAANAKVKAFGDMMVKDHGKANDQLMAIAKGKNITLPTAPDAEHQQKAQALTAKSGADFDKAYVAAMVDDHKKTIALFEDASKNCKDADLKAFATNTLPTLKGHLTEIEGIQKGM